MSELLFLQEEFQNYLLSDKSEIEHSIIHTEAVTAETRLNIYREAYKLRLIESVTTSFPGLHAYLGTDDFNALCGRYIDAHPSPYRSIRWYGDTLAEFIKKQDDKSLTYLAELADFEWKMTLAFDGADDPIVRVEDMVTVPGESWAGLQFALHASVQRVDYFWNVIPVWQALIHGSRQPEWQHSDHAVSWLLWRAPDYQIKFYSLAEEEAWALDALIQGLSFGELCEGLCHWVAVEEVGMRAASYLKSWIQNGIFSRLLIAD